MHIIPPPPKKKQKTKKVAYIAVPAREIENNAYAKG